MRSMHELNGRSGARLGPLWTTLVVAQVAVAVAVLPVRGLYGLRRCYAWKSRGRGSAAEKFVVGVVALGDEASAPDPSRIRGRQLELMSRLAGRARRLCGHVLLRRARVLRRAAAC